MTFYLGVVECMNSIHNTGKSQLYCMKYPSGCVTSLQSMPQYEFIFSIMKIN